MKRFRYLHKFKVSINSRKPNSNKESIMVKKIKIEFHLIKITDKIDG